VAKIRTQLEKKLMHYGNLLYFHLLTKENSTVQQGNSCTRYYAS